MFLKNELCDTEIFERADAAERHHTVQPEETKFLNLNKTVRLAAEQLNMSGNVPKIEVYDHPSPAFAIHDKSNSLHITEGLYNKLSNEQLRAIMILQTCLIHRAHEHLGKYQAATIVGGAIGAGAGTAAGAVVPAGCQGIVAALRSTYDVLDYAEPTSRRAFFRQSGVVAAVGLLSGVSAGKSMDDTREYKNWVQAAIADYTALSGDHDKTQLLGALTKMNSSLGKDRKEKFRECREAIGQFMAYAINTDASRLKQLQPTEQTRTYSTSADISR